MIKVSSLLIFFQNLILKIFYMKNDVFTFFEWVQAWS